MSLTITIAAPFRHTRKDSLKKNEIVYYLAFDRKWMNIEQANLILTRAQDEGLIGFEGDMIRPLFDVSLVEIPLGFKPSPSVFERDDPLQELAQRIVKETGQPITQVISEMNRIIAEEFDATIHPEAAIVILARRHRVQCDDLLPSLREHILRE